MSQETLFNRVDFANHKEELDSIVYDLKLKAFDKFDLTINDVQFDFFDTLDLPARGVLNEIKKGWDSIVLTIRGPWTYASELHKDDLKLVNFNGKDHIYKGLDVSLDHDSKEYTCTIQL